MEDNFSMNRVGDGRGAEAQVVGNEVLLACPPTVTGGRAQVEKVMKASLPTSGSPPAVWPGS